MGGRRPLPSLGGCSGPIHLRSEQLRVLGMIGHRLWLSPARLGIVPRLGLGYGDYTVTPSGHHDAAGAEAAARLSRDKLGPLPVAIELELSIAFGF